MFSEISLLWSLCKLMIFHLTTFQYSFTMLKKHKIQGHIFLWSYVEIWILLFRYVPVSSFVVRGLLCWIYRSNISSLLKIDKLMFFFIITCLGLRTGTSWRSKWEKKLWPLFKDLIIAICKASSGFKSHSSLPNKIEWGQGLVDEGGLVNKVWRLTRYFDL